MAPLSELDVDERVGRRGLFLTALSHTPPPPLSVVFLDMAVSLDGLVSGPDPTADPGLHDWYFDPKGDSVAVLGELQSSIGAMILGHRMAGDDGFETPYGVPHVVLTHHDRPTVTHGGASFHYVTGGVERVLARAREAAGARDVCVAGGAETARQFLAAGLVDEVRLHMVPVMLGGGLRLFEGVGPLRLETTRALHAPGVTHLSYRVVR